MDRYKSEYRNGYSANTVVCNLLDNIMLALDNNLSIHILLLDVYSTLYTLDHTILYNRIITYSSSKMDYVKYMYVIII